MKFQTSKALGGALIALAVFWLGFAGCTRSPKSSASLPSQSAGETKLLDAPKSMEPLSLVLAPHMGSGRLDSDIRRFQEQVRAGNNLNPALERLGWLFVAKARESFDPGYYKLAEACAQALEARAAGCSEALLLRGHVLQNLHRFKEVEPLARELVARRGLSFDYALLGDALMERGQLDNAVAAYQSMVDLRPDLHSYSRGAHIRWLKGDLTGALELMQLAVSASSPLDPESAAWVHTRLAFYRWQAGTLSEASRECFTALQYQSNYPPALLLQGRIRLAEGNAAEAIRVLQVAAERNPLPEYQWTLAEALRRENRETEAVEVETQLVRTGAANDPRTYSLYLSTRGQSLTTALRLAEKELQERSDVFTHDALAWALAASGNLQEAQREIEKALAEGTQDSRLYFHAAVIAARAGTQQQARHWFGKANEQMLLPTEQQQLRTAARVAGVASASEAAQHPRGSFFSLAETESTGSGKSGKTPQTIQR